MSHKVGLRRCAAGERLHGQGCCSRSCRPARTFSTACAFQDLSSPTMIGEPMVGRFRTAPADRRSISFVWSGDTAGQGWGIDAVARRHAHLRDNAEATGLTSLSTAATTSTPTAQSRPQQKLPNGEIWRNIVTEEKSKVGRNARRIPRQLQIQPARHRICATSMPKCPIFAQWDNHEVMEELVAGRSDRTRGGYAVKSRRLTTRRARLPRLS